MYMRKFGLSIVGLLLTYMAFATPVVTDITAKQRFPWNGLVDITVTLSGAEEECKAATCVFYATNKATNAELPIASVMAVGSVTGDGEQWIRRFVWNASADVGRGKFGEVALTVGKPSTGVQLWKDGPYWAECNIGALKAEETGYYFWWGDIIGYKRNASNDGWVSVMDGSSYSFDIGDCPTMGKIYSLLQSAGYIDLPGNLVATHDAATAYLGEVWRMPTSAEIDALISNCDTEWKLLNGVGGCLVKGRGEYASKSIFLPGAGYGNYSELISFGLEGRYWSSTPDSSDSYYAWVLHFNSSCFTRDRYSRCGGRPIRPVRGFAK